MDVKIILKNSSTTKIGGHIPSGFSTSTISSFKNIKTKHDIYRKSAWKSFVDPIEHTIEINFINYFINYLIFINFN